MREFNTSRLPTDVTYKDVVIIGNGPSGISLSYMLAGNWAYCRAEREPHADELLEARLNCAPVDASLMEQDLEMLADGLEGRSSNPVSLLLDNLQYPSADLGLELPSMVEWRFRPEKKIDHIVLGKGNAGGSWHSMDPHILTLSLGNWMSLPGFDFQTWLEKVGPLPLPTDEQSTKTDDIILEDLKVISTPRKTPNSTNEENTKLVQKSTQNNRAPVWQVAQYYEYYVKKQGLQKFFRNNTCVVNIKPIYSRGKYYCKKKSCGTSSLWSVTGYDLVTFEPFYYVCKNVVLASGASDLPNLLGIPGELTVENRNWLTHDVREFERQIEDIEDSSIKYMAPVLILGAGLSSADAVIAARARNIPVIHVFRHQFTGLDKQLPENMYPEYHKVHRMMKDPSISYPNYTALPEHTIISIEPNTFSPKEFFRHKFKFMNGYKSHKVRILNLKTNITKEMTISFCAILIGSRPDLTFLPENMNVKSEYLCSENAEPYFKSHEITSRLSQCALCRFCKVLRNQPATHYNYHASKLTSQSSDLSIGVNPSKPIDCRLNPIAVNKFTNKVLNTPPGLYAMGPLVGDNFVRFIPGGALAIVSDLHRNKFSENSITTISELDTRS